METRNYVPWKSGLRLVCLCYAVALITIFAACSKSHDSGNQYKKIQPSGPQPSWGPDITPQMLAVIETLDTISPIPLQTLTPQEARMQPTPADAVMRVMKNFGIPTPPSNVDTVGTDIPVDGGTIHVRSYTPRTGKAKYPVIVYYHGGGWVIATIDTYNASAQALAEQVDAIVVSVEYRKGPEFKFPTAHNDAFAAYRWVLANAQNMKGDTSKVAVAGESAGGNMAITVSMMARDSSIKIPTYELAVYPVAGNDLNTASYIKYADAKPLNKPLIQWFLKYYLNSPDDANSPLINLVGDDLHGLPSTTIIGAEIDPLQSEGKTLADRLNAAGVSTSYKLYTGVTHEFFGMATVVPEAKDAQAFAATALKNALWH